MHPSYNTHNVCKLGKTHNIPERDTHYATGEIIRGYFELVFEISIKQMGIIERLLQNEFHKLNIRYDAGTEFYNNEIITQIEPYLQRTNIKYTKLNKQQIDNLLRHNRLRKIIQKINIKSLIQTLQLQNNKQPITYTPRQDQIQIIDNAIIYFHTHDKGILVLTCGTGKTLISLWISQKINSNTILIGVPNKLLLKQWKEIINALFQNIPCLIVSAGKDIEHITQFLTKNHKKCIVVTTYSSSHKVYTATQDITFIFDMKINDEVHHLTTSNMRSEQTIKTYIQMLHIKSIKQISLTATLKQLENINNNTTIISNDNIEYFGKVIYKKCLSQAINENIICDYVIQTIITNEIQLPEFDITNDNDNRLFLSAFASLKSIADENSHHLLIYSNNIENSSKLIKYIQTLITRKYFTIPNLYYSDYSSNMKSSDQLQIITNFEKSTFGIITCVYCLGEGWDFPRLDGVVFAENMSSEIRIVQSALRASRINIKDTHKISKIILPILNKHDWLDNTENPDYQKVRSVIYQMGLEDETTTQKIKVFKLEIAISEPSDTNINNTISTLTKYDDELTQQLRLKTVHRIALTTTYDKARKIIITNNVNSKQNYYELCDKNNRLSKEPDIIFRGQFTNWIEYLSIKKIYYDLETCKSKVHQYLSTSPDIKRHYLDSSKVCEELCKIDALFPPNDLWVEYYNVTDLQDIIIITNKKKIDSSNIL